MEEAQAREDIALSPAIQQISQSAQIGRAEYGGERIAVLMGKEQVQRQKGVGMEQAKHASQGIAVE